MFLRLCLKKLNMSPRPNSKIISEIYFPVLKETKYPWVIFDSEFSFSQHIKYLRTNFNKSLNLLKVISRCDRSALLHLNRVAIRFQFDCGSFVSGSSCKSYIQILDPIHHHGLIIAIGYSGYLQLKVLTLNRMRKHFTHRVTGYLCNASYN